MDLLTLSAAGAKGLAAFRPGGVSIDFSQLPEGLIAVTGPNAAGKTTTLEAFPAALFTDWPSRPNLPGRAFADSFETRDGYLDVTWFQEGRGTYRARVNVDAVGRRTDALLTLTGADGDVRRLNDGKISTYKDAIARELLPPSVLFASALATQKKHGSFATADRAERRDIFASLLGHTDLEMKATAARAAASLVEKKIAALREVLAHLAPSTTAEQAEEIHHTSNRLQTELSTVHFEREDLEAKVSRLTGELETLRARTAQYDAALRDRTAQMQALEEKGRERQRIDDDVEALDHDEAAELEAIADRARQTLANERAAMARLDTDESLDAALAKDLRVLAANAAEEIRDREERIANNRQFLDQAAAVRDAATKVEQLEILQRGDDDNLTAAETALAECRRLLKDADVAVIAANSTVRDGERDLETAKLLERVPFGQKCAEASCSFVTAAVAAMARAEGLEGARASHDAAKASYAGALTSLTEAETEVNTVKRRRADRAAAIAKARETAKHLPSVDAAQDRITEREAEIVRIKGDLSHEEQAARDDRKERGELAGEARARHEAACVDAGARAQEERAALGVRVGKKRAELHARQTAVDKAVIAINADLHTAETLLQREAAAHDDLVAAETDLTSTRTALTEARTAAARLEAECTAFRHRQHEFRVRRDQREKTEAAAAALETALIEWQALARILGKDGLPALEIDAAGPGVSALANDLLDHCFDGRFSIDLITQQATTDGSGMREVFTLQVNDHVRGGSKDLSLCSGGEEVIVEEALRSAIALYVNQHNQMPIRTCMRDETIGALRPEMATRYVAMLRRLLERGGFKRLYYVTHNLQAAALADAQLVFGEGTVTPTFPPYAASSEAA